MGRVMTEATIESMDDLWKAKNGLIQPDQVRRVEVKDALVDTGATLLSLPTRLIQQLGLSRVGTKRVTASSGQTEAGMYEAVRLTIQGRSCTMDVLEVPDTVPVLIGQIPLEHLDFVVDLRDRKLIGNPAHGGEHVYEMYWAVGEPGDVSPRLAGRHFFSSPSFGFSSPLVSSFGAGFVFQNWVTVRASGGAESLWVNRSPYSRM
jgi:predicted aspartyl protease